MKIGLNLIMKNEEKVLPRLLESIAPIVDTYTVVDTGSTDSSKKIVKDFFDARGITGEIHDYAFTDFADTRNVAISKIKGKADYGLIIDSDEQLTLADDFDLEKFKKELTGFDTGNIIVEQGGTKYSRLTLFNTHKNFYWKGKVHNVLLCDASITNRYFKDEIKIKVNTDGDTWTKESQREKYLRQAAILEEEVKLYNKPRDIFYLAQSYRDGLEPEKALHWYQQRVKRNDGFYEEVYYSQFMIASLYKNLGDTPRAILEYMKCFELDSLRGEHVVNLIIALQEQGLYKAAQIYCDMGLIRYHGKNPYPNRKLFLHEPTYKDKFLELNQFNLKKIV